MQNIQFLVLGKNDEILATLKRLIENTDNWQAEISNDESQIDNYIANNPVDIILLSSGLDESFEQEIKVNPIVVEKNIMVIEHFGGGSGLLKNEIYAALPHLNPENQ
ncbi:hypothetical protein SAMN05660477_01927 [Soonwooa buanensis]|uniref:V/A-type H+-transporting ATPase subunit F n=1 Tax=Soonwooa buanensis TaxID=619805 RepID=A0A1T5FC61_9FLAO|nr:hypothetical protein [Soonwooa buanensis]SKB93751.1 hypothetical protein SAMN05660477_01927 [Soonwooa buanensis]